MEDVKLKIWDNIRIWWRWKAKYLHRDIIKGVKNLIRWFPIIWRDRDWDDDYIWAILKFKLKNQAKYIGNKDRHLSAKRDSEIMTLCVKLIDKVQTEYYQGEYTEYYKSDIYFVDSEMFPDSKEMKSEIIHENFDEYFAKYPKIYKQVIKEKETPFTKDTKLGIALNISHKNHNRAKKLLFTLMERNIERWWE
jgi:hypothetical protein